MNNTPSNPPSSTNDDTVPNPPKRHPTAPLPPRWRFLNEARKAHGYSTADAGRQVDGLSAEELGAKYTAPTFAESIGGRGDVEVGRLDICELRNGEEERLEGSFPGFCVEEDEEDSESGSSDGHPWMTICVSRGNTSTSCSEEEEKKRESDESGEELNATEEVSAEYIGDLTMLSDGSGDEHLSIPIHQRDVNMSNDTTTANDQDDAGDQKSTSFQLDGSFAQAISFDKSMENEGHQPILQRKKCAFALLLLLLCALSIALRVILHSNKQSNDPSENENSLKNLMYLSNATSNSPSVSLMPTLQPSSSCFEGTKPFAVNITQQNLMGWTSAEIVSHNATWVVREACSGNVVMECQPCSYGTLHDNIFEYATQREQCLSLQNEYIFEITSGGNGSCCGFAASSYKVVYDGDVVLEGDVTEATAIGFHARFRFGESNERCSTESPSALPSSYSTDVESMQPSMVPSSIASQQFTHVPSEQPSTLPSQQPTCNTNIDDFNLCLALDMSGSVCNQGTGFECNQCEPSLICNADGVPSNTCCNNFVNVIDFAKGMVSSLSELDSNQTYSVVQFATNATLVSSLTLSNRTLDALDEIVYTGGCEYLTHVPLHIFSLIVCLANMPSSSNKPCTGSQ